MRDFQDHDEDLRCEHCGAVCEDELELRVFHRGCRLGAAFRHASTHEGPFLKIDLTKISKKPEPEE